MGPWGIAAIVIVVLIIITLAIVLPIVLIKKPESLDIMEYSGPMFQQAGTPQITIAQQAGIPTTLNFGFNTASQGNFPIPAFIPKENIYIYTQGGEINMSNIVGELVEPPEGFPLSDTVYRSKQDYDNGFQGITSTRKREGIIRFHYKLT